MDNNLAIIIGVGPGLGLALAKKFHGEGFDICMLARNANKLDSYGYQMTKGSGKVYSYAADAGNKDSLTKALKSVINEHGTPDLLIYNVSLLRPSEPMGISYDSFIEDFHINVAGLLVAYQVIFPEMKKRGEGTILVTGGGLSLSPFYEFASLGVGKAGIRNLAISLAQEARDSGVKVYTITIDGMIEPATKYDPDLIADKFLEVYDNGLTPGEIEFIFR